MALLKAGHIPESGAYAFSLDKGALRYYISLREETNHARETDTGTVVQSHRRGRKGGNI